MRASRGTTAPRLWRGVVRRIAQNRALSARLRRDGEAVVDHIPMRLRRRNGRCMVLTEGEAAPVSAAQHVASNSGGGGNRTLIEGIAKGHR